MFALQIPIAEVVKHKLFSGHYPFRNDIALVRMAKAARPNPQVGHVCLPVPGDRTQTILREMYNSKALLLGWGKSRLDSGGKGTVLHNLAMLKT